MFNIFSFKKYIGNKFIDYKSWVTSGKIIIIESDDWGSLRTNNISTREKLNKISPAVSNDRYTQLDSLANLDDLTALFEVLNSVRDNNGNPARITANVCMANPDFDKIKKDRFQMFHYETFDTTIKKLNSGNAIWNLWKEGIKDSFIQPQLHGREHVHALQWLAELRAGNEDLLKAFELESFGIPYKPLLLKRRNNLQAALDIYGLNEEEEFQKKCIEESSDIFEKVFGFRSITFIPPAYIWHNKIDKVLCESGIKALQGIKLQYQPKNRGYKRKFHYTGQKKNGLGYLVRNVFFEPASSLKKDWVDITISGIDRAFSKDQPAIIGSHRLNFIGSLEEKNRTQNLAMLKKILQRIVQKYPDVEFMSSDQLYNQISKKC